MNPWRWYVEETIRTLMRLIKELGILYNVPQYTDLERSRMMGGIAALNSILGTMSHDYVKLVDHDEEHRRAVGEERNYNDPQTIFSEN